MSAQIHLTPEEIERFAKILEQFSGDLYGSTQTLNTNLQQLGDTWKDSSFSEFESEFVAVRKHIEEFVRSAHEHVAFLKRKAEAGYIARDQK